MEKTKKTIGDYVSILINPPLLLKAREENLLLKKQNDLLQRENDALFDFLSTFSRIRNAGE